MKWIHIQFNSTDIYSHQDAVFVRQFVKFSHSVKHPKDLCLYSLRFSMDDGTAYYISTPDDMIDKVKTVFTGFNHSEVKRPNLNLLNLEFGNERLF
mgnify:CR=1 FL=1